MFDQRHLGFAKGHAVGGGQMGFTGLSETAQFVLQDFTDVIRQQDCVKLIKTLILDGTVP